MKRSFLLLASLLLLGSCIYPYDVQLTESEQMLLVVDGDIAVGDRATLKLSATGYNGPVLPDEWWVEDNQGGVYKPKGDSMEVDLRSAPTDRQYRMIILFNGKRYVTAFQGVLEPPVIEKIGFSADDNTVTCGVSFTGGTQGSGYVAFTYEEIYQFHADYSVSYIFDPDSLALIEMGPDMKDKAPTYYCWTKETQADEVVVDYTKLDSESAKDYPLMRFSRYNNRNHKDYRIKVWGRTITQEEYDFRNNLANLGRAGSNLFTPNPGEMAGNVRCETDPSERAMGYVTLSSSSSMTGTLDDRYAKYKNLDNTYLEFPEPDMYERYYFVLGFRPVKDALKDDGSRGVGWGPLRCVDCLAAGGVLDEPQFRD